MSFERRLCEFVAKNNEIHLENRQSIDPDWMRKMSKLKSVLHVLELICNFYFMPINSLRSIKFNGKFQIKWKAKRFQCFLFCSVRLYKSSVGILASVVESTVQVKYKFILQRSDQILNFCN